MLIRANQNRRLLDEEEEKLWDYLESCPLKRGMKIEVPAKNKRPDRVATVELRYAAVEIKRPKRASSALEESILLSVKQWEDGGSATQAVPFSMPDQKPLPVSIKNLSLIFSEYVPDIADIFGINICP